MSSLSGKIQTVSRQLENETSKNGDEFGTINVNEICRLQLNNDSKRLNE